MKAIAVYPGKPNSIHLAELPTPQVADIPDGRGVLAKLLKCGHRQQRIRPQLIMIV